MATNLQTFVEKINEAFTTGDYDFLAENSADDIVWTMVGDQEVRGRDNFVQFMKDMSAPGLPSVSEMNVTSVITHGRQAACEGTMKMTFGDGTVKTYGFCDVYGMSGFKNAKIKSITSYVIEIGDRGR